MRSLIKAGASFHSSVFQTVTPEMKWQKKRRMQEEFQFQMTREIEERSALMCNVSALIVEKGMQKGIKEGIKEGIKQEKANSLLTAAQLSKEYGIPMETALSKLKARKEWEDSAVDRVVQLVYMG